MAVLVDQDRFDVWAEFMRENSAAVSISKGDLRAAVNAIDQWVNDNSAAFNAAIPQPARGTLTSSQKAALLMYVVKKRFAKGA